MLPALLQNSSDSMNIKRVVCILNAVTLGTAATLEEATAMAFRHNERARGVSGQQLPSHQTLEGQSTDPADRDAPTSSKSVSFSRQELPRI